MRNWPFKVEQPGAKLGADTRRYVLVRFNQWGTKVFRNAKGTDSLNPVFAHRFTADEAEEHAAEGWVKEATP